LSDIGLVTCTEEKLDKPARPEDLYSASSLFILMRQYCETVHDRWYILSAKHGLLEPRGDEIAPYNVTLKTASRSEKITWSKSVFQSLQDRNAEGHTVYFYAEPDYYSELLPLLDEADIKYERPLRDVSVDEFEDWFNTKL
jgi:hypothetical protein